MAGVVVETRATNVSPLVYPRQVERAAETAETPARADFQFAVIERHLNDFIDFRHAAEDRRGPGRRERVDALAGARFAQAGEKRLRQQRVADPVGRDDQSA